jgi:predicted dehydrogenase
MSSTVLAAQKHPLKVAVIGCGHIGSLHAKAVDESSLAELVGLCDISLESRQHLSSLYGGIPTFSNVEELLSRSRPDVVSIATPDHVHAEPAITAARAGCHAFVEKPMAMTLDEARAMAAVAHDAGRHMAIDYNRRFGFAYRKALSLIQEGAIGTVKQITLTVTDGIPASAKDRGPHAILYLLLSHHIDLLRMVGGEIKDVHAAMRENESGQVDTVSASFRHENGALSQLSGAWIAGQGRTEEQMILTGTSGVIIVDDVLRGVRLRKLNPDIVESYSNSVFSSEATFYDTVRIHLHSFLSAVAEGRTPEVTAHDGVRGLEIIEGMIGSAARR